MISRFKILVRTGEGREQWVDGDKLFTRLLGDYNKQQAKLQDNFEKRLEKFKASVYEFKTEHDTSMLGEFIEYWTEPNKSGKKMRFELEKTWKLSMRLKKWKRNGFGKKEDKVEDGRSNYKKYVPPETKEEDLLSMDEINELMQGIKKDLTWNKK
tara:strand:+ start:2853 stop:3317 length:465 start_codon:yes stop_codon:yes gene_type:complete